MEQLGNNPNWGFQLLAALKKYQADERTKAAQAPEIINKAIREVYPTTEFRLPFFCDQHNYGIG